MGSIFLFFAFGLRKTKLNHLFILILRGNSFPLYSSRFLFSCLLRGQSLLQKPSLSVGWEPSLLWLLTCSLKSLNGSLWSLPVPSQRMRSRNFSPRERIDCCFRGCPPAARTHLAALSASQDPQLNVRGLWAEDTSFLNSPTKPYLALLRKAWPVQRSFPAEAWKSRNINVCYLSSQTANWQDPSILVLSPLLDIVVTCLVLFLNLL